MLMIESLERGHRGRHTGETPFSQYSPQHNQELQAMDLTLEVLDTEKFRDLPSSAIPQGRNLNENAEFLTPRPMQSPLWHAAFPAQL